MQYKVDQILSLAEQGSKPGLIFLSAWVTKPPPPQKKKKNNPKQKTTKPMKIHRITTNKNMHRGYQIVKYQ
jgi:DNA polymerase elongation subunit (family B)